MEKAILLMVHPSLLLHRHIKKVTEVWGRFRENSEWLKKEKVLKRSPSLLHFRCFYQLHPVAQVGEPGAQTGKKPP